MSDTPRTDGVTRTANSCELGRMVVPTCFSRQLERELAELQKDKARLDWLDSKWPIIESSRVTGRVSMYTAFINAHCNTHRAAIDAAMAAERKDDL